MLIFRDIPKSWCNPLYINSLMCRNNELKEFAKKLEVIRISKRHDVAFVKCENEYTYSQILAKKKLRLDWSVIHVQPYVDLRRCFKCQQYNHIAKECTNKIACAQCGGEHDVKDCVSTSTCCVNCIRARTEGPKNHCSWSHECPVLQSQARKIK